MSNGFELSQLRPGRVSPVPSWEKTADPRLAFATSGTTGQPKTSEHRLSWLAQESGYFDQLLPAGRRVGVSVPGHHIYGSLWAVLLPVLGHRPTFRIQPEAPQWSSDDVLITHPFLLSQWRHRGLSLPKGLTVVTSTSTLSVDDWDHLERSGVDVFEIYGSSETAGLGWRKSVNHPFELLPWWKPVNTERSESPSQPLLQREGRPEPLLAPDVWEWVDSTKFFPRGRGDQSVKIAGRLVSLAGVRQELLLHPQIRDVALRIAETLGTPAQSLCRRRGRVDRGSAAGVGGKPLGVGGTPHRVCFRPGPPRKTPGARTKLVEAYHFRSLTSLLLPPNFCWQEIPMNELKTTARVTGLWYLGLAITGALGFLMVRSAIFVPDDAVATLRNLVDQALLARFGVALEMGVVVTQALAALWFFKLFRPLNSFAAGSLAAFGFVNSLAVLSSAALLATALAVSADSHLAPSGDVGATVQLIYVISASFWSVGQLFFGLWLIPMGFVATSSGRMPKVLGWILIAGGAGYLASAFVANCWMSAPGWLASALTAPASVGEFWMIGYLLTVGIRRPKEVHQPTNP